MNRALETSPIAPDLIPIVPRSRMVSNVIANARSLDERALHHRTFAAYIELHSSIRSSGGGEVVRMWNFIPDLLAPTEAGRDRYMSFNEGRYEAMCEWFGGESNLLTRAPAASGVGTSSDDLSIHALIASEPGVAFQNPRQAPAVCYSKRFGPRPPCFARATRCGDVLLVSGTAAITGEDSVVGSLELQLGVTFQNLRALLHACYGHDDLGVFRHVRAYFPRITDTSEIERRTREEFGVAKLELVNVDLCRRELLVEIEGVAGESRL